MSFFRAPVSAPRPEKLAERPDDGDVLYRQANLVTRAVIGILGVALPIIFIIGESFFLRGGVQVRGSLSAYYHTSMRDIFVAGLCIIGFFLMTYMSGQLRTSDFWFSLVAGFAVVLVVFFPTMRPDLAPGAPRCGATPMPAGCSPIQQALGERYVAWVHFTSAAVFILSLAAMCFFVFAKSERKAKHPGMAAVMYFCGLLILLAVAWAVVGGLRKTGTVWQLTPLWVGEVVSVWTFGIAWLLKARDLLKALSTRGVTDVPQPQRPAAPLSGGPDQPAEV